jgi:tetratricopeptide (TPR) repeat protein
VVAYVSIAAVFPGRIPEDKLPGVLELITRSNDLHSPIVGRFTLDFKKGRVAFQSVQRIDCRKSDGGLGSCMEFLNALLGGFHIALRAMTGRGIAAEQAIELAEKGKVDEFRVSRPEHFARRMLRLGDRYGKRGDFESALWCFEQGIRYLPDDPQLLNSKATVLVIQERWAEALEFVERAIGYAPGNGLLWSNRGIVLTELGRYEEALASLWKAEQLGLCDAGLHDCRARCLYELKRFDESLRSIERALADTPGNAELWAHRGCVLAELGRHEEALKAYDEALALDPSDFSVLHNRASSLEELGRYESARESHEMAVRTYEAYQRKSAGAAGDGIPANTALEPYQTWLKIGDGFSDAGLWHDAIYAYDRSLELKRGNPDALKGKAFALGKLGLLKEAGTVYRRVLRRDPNDAEAWYNLHASRKHGQNKLSVSGKVKEAEK